MGDNPEYNAYANLWPRQKDKLNILFEEIVPKVEVDYGNTEMQDIHIAVKKLLMKGVDRINGRGIFSISRIAPCGSMAEKTAVWRTRNKSLETLTPADFQTALPSSDTRNMYIEFDYVAIMDGSMETILTPGCSKCYQVKNPPIYRQHMFNSEENSFRNPRSLDNAFLEELNTCFCCKTGPHTLTRMVPEVKNTSAEVEHICYNCSVEMPTGRLQINIAAMKRFVDSIPTSCSLICRWTSKARSLSDRNIDGRISSPTSQSLEFYVYIDFLPAIQTSYHFCIVPKQCAYCDEDRWRRSGFLAELNYVRNMSNKHHKCYRIVKYMSGLIKLKLETHGIQDVMPWYYIKVLFLHHISLCKDFSDDYAGCVLRIFQELLNAYKSKEIKSIHSPANLLSMTAATLNDYKNLANELAIFIPLLCNCFEHDSCETY